MVASGFELGSLCSLPWLFMKMLLRIYCDDAMMMTAAVIKVMIANNDCLAMCQVLS